MTLYGLACPAAWRATWLKCFSLWCLPFPAPSQPQAPAVPTEKKLEEFPVEEAQVLQILTQVNVVRRECEIVSVREGARPGGPRVLP